MSNFTVVIPSKTVSNLVPCLDAIWRNEPNLHRSSVVVIDDGLAYRPEGPTYIDGIKDFVFSRNVNLGLRATTPRSCFVVNDDCLLIDPHGFTKLYEVAEQNQDYGVIGAVTNLTGQPLQQPRGIGLRHVPHFAFVCVFIPRRTIERVGFMDERYCLDYGCDDRDYCEAVKRAGLKCGVFDHCFVDHSQLQSTFRGAPTASRSFAKNYALLVEKWGALA